MKKFQLDTGSLRQPQFAMVQHIVRLGGMLCDMSVSCPQINPCAGLSLPAAWSKVFTRL